MIGVAVLVFSFHRLANNKIFGLAEEEILGFLKVSSKWETASGRALSLAEKLKG